jgi:hypothetical protein
MNDMTHGPNDMRILERDVETNDNKISARGVQVYYGTNHALKDVSMSRSSTRRSPPSSAPRAAASPPSCAA